MDSGSAALPVSRNDDEAIVASNRFDDDGLDLAVAAAAKCSGLAVLIQDKVRR
jgi:hypothetical protein